MTSRKQVTEQKAADALAALGNRTRLRIFKLLVRAGPEGTNIGDAAETSRHTGDHAGASSRDIGAGRTDATGTPRP